MAIIIPFYKKDRGYRVYPNCSMDLFKERKSDVVQMLNALGTNKGVMQFIEEEEERSRNNLSREEGRSLNDRTLCDQLDKEMNKISTKIKETVSKGFIHLADKKDPIRKIKEKNSSELKGE